MKQPLIDKRDETDGGLPRQIDGEVRWKKGTDGSRPVPRLQPSARIWVVPRGEPADDAGARRIPVNAAGRNLSLGRVAQFGPA